MRRFGPTSLPGQIALLVALALFVAQALNFALLLRERRAFRLAEITLPAVTRLIDAAERTTAPRPAQARDRMRGVRLLTDRVPTLRGETERDVEAAIRSGFAEAGIRPGRIAARIRPIDEAEIRERGIGGPRAERLRRMGAVLDAAVELPGRGWLVSHTPWPMAERGLLWQSLAQTFILYVIVLLPVLWIGRRIAKPLRRLAVAARAFHPARPLPAIEPSGPQDVRLLIAAFTDLGQRVNAMVDEKDRMLGAIGHDLRTPLAALRVRIESVEDDTDRARMAETIDEMNATLDDILSLARLGRPSEAATDVDVAALVDAVVEDFRDLGNDVDFVEAARVPLHLRPNLMRRAVRNLIENAIKYAGSAEVRVETGTDAVAIIVDDQGPGIPADRLDAVFDPFTRLETSRNRDTGGIGLGLALARAIVRDAGGEIALANRDGGGLNATIRLPR
ncbi:sensor histidine kinase [Sphingomonas sp. Leaf10]|uniref:sensor histidine kinase n=1 Tax=Sphingomonas sp. Leaf10 TaxID=1735676 RepID=UPI0006FE41EF|nr:HAMP domain-containing sensor histidine kinase [Sphingomonas sp. Leaf10]KQM35831.1 signal protein [Sphingomonas sp. Leaf10]